MQSVTLNLFSLLGVTNKKRVKHSPALTLTEGGLLTIWDEWDQSCIDPLTRGGGHQVKNQHVVDVTTVEKILYKDTFEQVISAGEAVEDLTELTGINFYQAMAQTADLYFALDPLWLASPQLQQFLTQYVRPGIRNDFNPEKQWQLRRRHRLHMFDSTSRVLKSTSSVVGRLGSITWEHETGIAQVSVHEQHSGWMRNDPPGYLILRDGRLSALA